MEKLIIERDEGDFYRLEVNDKGEYIEFDLLDIGLPEKMIKAVDDIRNIDEEYTNNVNAIIKLEEITQEEKVRKLLAEESKYFEKMTAAYDSFLGEGACKKIFGDKKVYGQYKGLMASLEPHFEKMHIKQQKAKRKLADRYLNQDSDVL